MNNIRSMQLHCTGVIEMSSRLCRSVASQLVIRLSAALLVVVLSEPTSATITVDFLQTGADDVSGDFGSVSNPLPDSISFTDLVIGGDAPGSLLTDGGSDVDADFLTIGRDSAGDGLLRVIGNFCTLCDGDVSVPGMLTVGEVGIGRLEASGGAQVWPGGLTMGVHAGSVGSVTLAGDGTSLDLKATGIVDVSTASVTVGQSGEAVLNMSDGSRLVAEDLIVSQYADPARQTPNGLVVATGSETELELSGTIALGRDTGYGRLELHAARLTGPNANSLSDIFIGGFSRARGEMVLTDGAFVQVDEGYVGSDNGASGDLAIQGSVWINNYMAVGYRGAGRLSISHGSLVSPEILEIGSEQTGVGDVYLESAGEVLTGGEVTVGDEGSGSLTIRSGASLRAGDQVFVGRETGAVGTVTNSGGIVATGNGFNPADPDLEIGFAGTGTYTQTAGTTAVASQLIVGNTATGNGTLNLSGGTITAAGEFSIVGQDGIGVANVSGGGSLATTTPIYVGRRNGAVGELNITDGGTVSTGDSVRIAAEAGSTGTLHISGAGSSLSTQGPFSTGYGGAGTTLIDDGATVTVDNGGGAGLWVGLFESGDGDLTIDGADTTVEVIGLTAVGDFGRGVMRLQNGATLTSPNASLAIGWRGANGNGTVILSQDSVIETGANDVIVGASGTGRLEVRDTARLGVADDLSIGGGASGVGTVKVFGGEVHVGTTAGDNGRHLFVGLNGDGDYEQIGGVVAVAEHLYIAHEEGSTGNADVSGGTLSVVDVYAKQNNTSDSDAVLQVTGTGVLNASGQGVLDNGATLSVVNGAANFEGALRFQNGAGMIALLDATVTAESVSLQVGGAAINRSGNLTLADNSQLVSDKDISLGSDSRVLMLGSASVRVGAAEKSAFSLTAGSQFEMTENSDASVNGDFTINDGALVSLADSSLIRQIDQTTVAGDVVLDGGGLFTGSLHITETGSFDFRSGTLLFSTFNGDLLHQQDGRMFIRNPVTPVVVSIPTLQVDAGEVWIDIAAEPDTQTPQMLIGGSLDVAPGGTELFIRFENNYAPGVGDEIEVMRFDELDEFEIVTAVGLSSVLSMRSEVVTNSDSSESLMLYFAPALAGDFNTDGIVDAADYTVWRDSLNATGSGLAADANLDGTVDVLDYALWSTNFGAVLPTNAAAVPEPRILIAVWANIAWIACSRSSRRGVALPAWSANRQTAA
ncbi:MAG: dockerin type I domain-containing protein [Planctomycetota bacterium]